MNAPGLTILDERIKEVIDPGVQWVPVINDCRFTEGPVWHPDGYYLFSDVAANCIYKWNEGELKEVLAINSGTNYEEDPDLNPEQIGSNGLGYTKDGIIVCQHGNHALSCLSHGKLFPFLLQYRGRPFNSPNDLVIHSNGTIYFSDPPYGLKDGQLNKERYQPHAGVYAYKNSSIELISSELEYPNGVCLSPDESLLYICSHKPFEKKILVYETEKLQFRGILAEENSDGLKCDQQGNLFLFNREGIVILNEDGARMAVLSLPVQPANGCWGGKNGCDMLVTARNTVYHLKNFSKVNCSSEA